MGEHRSFVEDLPSIAAKAYKLSARLCNSCANQHALWTYLRLSKASIGAEQQDSRLEAQLGAYFEAGARDILIAGAQDTGLLALVARAGARDRPNIMVLDLCETPLQLCRSLAKQWSLPIETVRQDLYELRAERRFDLVLMHGTLNFIAADQQHEVLRRLHLALRASGRLVLLFNTSTPAPADVAATSRATYADVVLTELNRMGVALPDSEQVLRDRLGARAQQREMRDKSFADPGEVEALLRQAGFRIENCTRVDADLAKPVDTLLAKFSKRRFMAIAKPNSAGDA
jgi:2-polyprenyl-3-methyl-5-hydroxy-6-metoxy-1,4-benzoquinol methylase